MAPMVDCPSVKRISISRSQKRRAGDSESAGRASGPGPDLLSRLPPTKAGATQIRLFGWPFLLNAHVIA
jgi:hypothetical protein